jgi:hypothetical protein
MTPTPTPTPTLEPHPRSGQGTRDPLSLALFQCPQRLRAEPKHTPVGLRVDDEDGHHVGAVGHGDDLVDEFRDGGDANGVALVELLGVYGVSWILGV